MSILNKNSKAALSTGRSVTVCGHRISAMPLGKYLSALERIQGLPSDFMETCFPGQSLQEVLDSVSSMNQEGLVSLASGMFVTAPGYLLSFVAELTGIDEDKLANDPDIGLNGLLEIITAFIEVNRLGEFIAGAKGLLRKLQALTVK